MISYWIIFFYWAFAYLAGSLPFGLWITRSVKNVDIRDGGSGHVGATNTIRQAGFASGIAVLLLDISKGFIPIYLALRAELPAWSLAVTAGLVVIGHCYPIFANFRGGMGLAVAGGATLAVSIPAFFICLALLIFLLLVIRHSARAALLGGILAPFLLYALGYRDNIIWVNAASGFAVAIRFTIDWNRKYHELWLDRKKIEN